MRLKDLLLHTETVNRAAHAKKIKICFLRFLFHIFLPIRMLLAISYVVVTHAEVAKKQKKNALIFRANYSRVCVIEPRATNLVF